MLSNKIGTLKQDLTDLRSEVEDQLIKNPTLSDRFEKLEEDLKSYLEDMEICLVTLR